MSDGDVSILAFSLPLSSLLPDGAPHTPVHSPPSLCEPSEPSEPAVSLQKLPHTLPCSVCE